MFSHPFGDCSNATGAIRSGNSEKGGKPRRYNGQMPLGRGCSTIARGDRVGVLALFLTSKRVAAWSMVIESRSAATISPFVRFPAQSPALKRGHRQRRNGCERTPKCHGQHVPPPPESKRSGGGPRRQKLSDPLAEKALRCGGGSQPSIARR